MNTLLFLIIAILIPVFISLLFIPYWTRRTESFGVSIPEEVYQQPKLKAMRKQYVMIMAVLSLLTLVIVILFGTVFYPNDEYMMSIVLSVAVGAYIIISFAVYLIFHKQMKELKLKENWRSTKSQLIVIDTQFRNQKLTYSNGWYMISFVISVATIVLTFSLYDKIPSQIPMQYNFSGEVTNWANKSYRTVLVLPLMQVYMTLLFLFINTIIAKAKQQISANNPEKSTMQNIIFRRRWSLFMIITGTLLTIMFSFIQLSFIYPINQQLLTIVPLIFSGIIVIGSIILAITTGQGGSRIKTITKEDGHIIDRDDDKYWKLGVFYFNRNDPALFLEKRFGIGWSFNCAHPITWIILFAIIAAAIGIPLLLGI